MFRPLQVAVTTGLLWISASNAAAADSLFASCPGRIVQFVDHNLDGDFLDYAESATYADGLPDSLDGITWHDGRLFALAVSPPAVYLIVDRNGDGDALDFAEVATFAFLESANSARGLAVQSDGALFTGDPTSGHLYKIIDLNNDGDALDLDELSTVAENLDALTALAIRPDGQVLVALNDIVAPIRILSDRNSDGDYLDFAENLSYAEDIDPGWQLVAPHNDLSFLTRQTTGEVIALRDRTGDDDVLDFAEQAPFAVDLQSPAAIVAASHGLFISLQNPSATLLAVRDLNGDDDAFDFAEIIPIATGITGIKSLALAEAQNFPCVKGDLNQDGQPTPGDIPLFAGALTGTSQPDDLCRADMNDDGQLDALDVPLFTAALLN